MGALRAFRSPVLTDVRRDGWGRSGANARGLHRAQYTDPQPLPTSGVTGGGVAALTRGDCIGCSARDRAALTLVFCLRLIYVTGDVETSRGSCGKGRSLICIALALSKRRGAVLAAGAVLLAGAVLAAGSVLCRLMAWRVTSSYTV